MTLAMPDSVTVGNLPMGYPAYLGYVDGDFQTAARLPALFPGAQHLTLTVTGNTLNADGIDCEEGDVDAAGAADWVKRKLAADPGSRPAVYADLATVGYSMAEVIAALLNLGIARVKYRVLTAHYGWKPGGDAEHICSPSTCGTAFTADGTQWTDSFPGIGGSKIDMSLLADDFFGSWIFSVCRAFKLTAAGPHSAAFSWESPAVPEPEAVERYELTVRHLGLDVAEPAKIRADVHAWQWNDLDPDTAYQGMVRAVAKDGHASPWAAVDFTTE
jgi:hypothetical protein